MKSTWLRQTQPFYTKRKPNPFIPNANYISLAHIGDPVGHYWLVSGIIGSRWGGPVESTRVF